MTSLTNWLVVCAELFYSHFWKIESNLDTSIWLCAAFVRLQVPLLEAGDIIIDGGNSEYRDTTVSH